jgi:hypothetical protein
MNSCNCVLPYTNPGACFYCKNRWDFYPSYTTWKDSSVYKYKEAGKKRVIERFDDKGNLVERVTEDV